MSLICCVVSEIEQTRSRRESDTAHQQCKREAKRTYHIESSYTTFICCAVSTSEHTKQNNETSRHKTLKLSTLCVCVVVRVLLCACCVKLSVCARVADPPLHMLAASPTRTRRTRHRKRSHRGARGGAARRALPSLSLERLQKLNKPLSMPFVRPYDSLFSVEQRALIAQARETIAVCREKFVALAAAHDLPALVKAAVKELQANPKVHAADISEKSVFSSFSNRLLRSFNQTDRNLLDRRIGSKLFALLKSVGLTEGGNECFPLFLVVDSRAIQAPR